MSAGPSLVYRETFLRDRLSPERRAVVRAFGDILEELTLEVVAMLPHVGTRGELGAVAVDLGHLADLLQDNSRDDEPQLIRASARWADRLREVEAELREQVES